MMKQGILATQIQNSPLLSQKRIRATGMTNKKKNLLFSMNLTTLIDAFCILVIFLLSNMNGQLQNVEIGKKTSLPTAVASEIMSTGVIVRIEDNDIFVDNKNVSSDELVKLLVKSKTEEKKSLIIQADKNANYDKISLLLQAGSIAGFEKYAFAVLPGTYTKTQTNTVARNK